MVRPRGPTRTWSWPYAAWPPATHRPGASISRGWSSPTTPSLAPRPDCLPSRPLWAINLHRRLLLLEQVPSIQEYWKATRSALERTQDNSRRSAIRHRQPAPSYQPGQLVWLSTQNIPLATRSRKVIPASSLLSLLRTS